MTKFDEIGLNLCELQANLFVESLKYDISSYQFIKKYMFSEAASLMDDKKFFSLSTKGFSFEIDSKAKGNIKINSSILYWVGYIYRYWAYTYGISSKEIYKIISGKELCLLYEPYHTLDPAMAIERIYESKNITKKDKLELLKEIYKK